MSPATVELARSNACRWQIARQKRGKLEKQLQRLNSYGNGNGNGNGNGDGGGDGDRGADDKELMVEWVEEIEMCLKDWKTVVSQLVAIANSRNFERDSLEENDGGNEDMLSKTANFKKTLQYLRDGPPPTILSFDPEKEQSDDYQLLIALQENHDVLRSSLETINSLNKICRENLNTLEDARKELFNLADACDERELEAIHEQINACEGDMRKLVDRRIDGVLASKLEADIVEFEEACCKQSYNEGNDSLLESIIKRWTSFSRKHSVQPNALVNVYSDLKLKLTSGEELTNRLKEHIIDEENAKEAYISACEDLTAQRKLWAGILSATVSDEMSKLGFQSNVVLRVSVKSKAYDDDTLLKSTQPGCVGMDFVDFNLVDENKLANGKGGVIGEIDTIASSGERSRILLILESVVPGCIGGAVSASYTNEPPIMTIFDEIDAHIGGRAAKSCAEMMAQSQAQCLSITHSGVVASFGKKHLCVKDGGVTDFGFGNGAGAEQEEERLQEIIRMISGEKKNEGKEFAKRLLKEGAEFNSS